MDPELKGEDTGKKETGSLLCLLVDTTVRNTSRFYVMKDDIGLPSSAKNAHPHLSLFGAVARARINTIQETTSPSTWPRHTKLRNV
jgi:hypothetical protein